MKIYTILLFAIFVFLFQDTYAQNTKVSASENYPVIPESLLKAEITLNDESSVRLNDYNEETVILTFIAHWATPVRRFLPTLNDIYAESLPNVRIFGINIDDESGDSKEKANFTKFIKKMNVKFQTGRADKNFIDGFCKISRFQGVPQTFVFKNGRLRSVFAGFSAKANEKLVETVRDISRE